MIKHKFINFYVVILLLIIITSCSNEAPNNGIIEIDAYKKYPKLTLDLNDIAEIRYIPLRLGEDTIFLDPGVRRSFFAMSDKFFLQEVSHNDPKIVVYDYDGHPLYKIGNQGRGPGEFMAPFNYVVDTSRNEVYISSVLQDQLIVYDTDGNYKRSAYFTRRLRMQNVDLINSRTFIGYNPNATYLVASWLSGADNIKKTGKTLTLIDLDSLSLVDFPDVSFERIYNSNQIWTTSKSIVNSGGGFYFFSICSDTTYHISSSLEITPRFVDVSNYPNKGEIGIFPAIETDRYVFLCSHPTHYKGMRELDKKQIKLLAYDKVKKKLFDLNGEIGKKNPDGSSDSYSIEALNYFSFSFGKTLSPNYLVTSLSYRYLSENYANLPDTLKRITDNMTEKDNPVLQVVKFY
ncbi:MAG: 6-bladed beta-propeller [Bacteroidales bacterium]